MQDQAGGKRTLAPGRRQLVIETGSRNQEKPPLLLRFGENQKQLRPGKNLLRQGSHNRRKLSGFLKQRWGGVPQISAARAGVQLLQEHY